MVTEPTRLVRWGQVVPLVLFVLLAACNKATAPVPVSLAVSKTPLSAPVYLAADLGYFADEGVQVTLDEVIGGPRSFAQVLDGRSTLGTASDSVMMFQGFETDQVVILTSFVQSDNDVKILVQADSGITGPGDFVGKRVGVVSNSASEFFLHVYLSMEGVQLSQVSLHPMAPEAMEAALKQDEIDAAVIWEPFAFLTIRALGEEVKLLPGRSLFTLTFNLLAQRQWAQANQAQAEAVLRALQRAIAYIHANPQAARERLRARLALDPAFIDWTWGDYLFGLSLNRSLLASMNDQARWLVTSRQLDAGSVPDYRGLIAGGAMARVSPTASFVR